MSPDDRILARVEERLRRVALDYALGVAQIAGASLDLTNPELSDQDMMWAIAKAHRLFDLAYYDYQRRIAEAKRTEEANGE